MLTLALVWAALLSSVPVLGQYNLVKEYAGPTFLDDWNFYGSYDNLTLGNVTWVDASTARSQKLAYVDSATNHTILRVDNTTKIPSGQKRNSVRLNTNDLYGVGTVWVADFLHVPFGCSVWGAFWSTATQAELGSDIWPTGGEIDTFEAYNLEKSSQTTLHTREGCSIANSPLVNTTNCDSSFDTAGCSVTNADPRSYGSAFAQANGGVFITEFASSGINVWFFSRSDVPSALSGSYTTVNMSTLGKPTMAYPASSCDINNLFKPQSLVFDITLCGDLAGLPAIYNRTCSGSCYADFVLDPSKYNDAYFEVASVRVFAQPNATVILGPPSSSTTAGTPSITKPSSQSSADTLANPLFGTFMCWLFSGVIAATVSILV